MSLESISRRVPRCEACPRLARYVRESARRLDDGWCRPVPGFGDPEASLLILGLAPGLRGANRTGRPFTGDGAGEWLYRALHEAGLSSEAVSRARHDDLELDGAWITNAVKCAPPGNRPKREEFEECRSRWLVREWADLPSDVILALGGDAHREVLRLLQASPLNRWAFAHGAVHRPREAEGPTLVDSYHPSRQNTNTGRLSWADFLSVVRKARDLARG